MGTTANKNDYDLHVTCPTCDRSQYWTLRMTEDELHDFKPESGCACGGILILKSAYEA